MKTKLTMVKVLMVSFLALSSHSMLHAQDSISVKDAGEISYRAELVINEYRDLLNIISNAQTEIKETKDLILNSYNNSKNRIFFDSSILIEDDLDPAIRNSQASKDLSVASYLNNLDLFYSKSDTSTVTFSNIKVSNIKQGEYMYVKVYFTSEFRGKNTLNDVSYGPNRRVAEIRISKQGNKWTGAIMNIGFFEGADVASDTTNDIKLSYASADIQTEGSTTSGGVMNASYNNIEESLREKERLKQVAVYNQEKKAFDNLIENGDKFFAAGDFASASKAFTEAQELKPYEIYPKLKLAQIRKQAEASTISAAELFKQFISKAQIAENARRYEQAKEYYMNAFSQKPEEADKYKDRLKVLNNKIRILSELSEKYITGLYKEAIKSYDAAIKKDNTNSDFYLGRAKCYDKLNEYSKALKDYSKSIDLDNNNLEALQFRADLYKRNNDLFKALTDYKMYLTVDKFNLDIYAELSDLHLMTNNVKAAIEDLDNALEINPKAAAIYYKKGLLYQRQQNLNNAIENFTTSIQLDSNAVLSYYYRGESKLQAAKIESAAVDFEMARVKGLDSVRQDNIARYASEFSQKGANFFQLGRVDSAIKQVSYAILIHPRWAPYRFDRGEYFYELQSFGDAIHNYDKAINLDGSYEQAFYKRGLAYFRQMNYEVAIENFSAVLKLNPGNYMAMKGMGDSYFQLGSYADAVTQLEGSLRVINSSKAKVRPEVLASIYNELGRSCNQVGRYANAIESCKSAIKINKDYGDAYFNRGYAYFRSGELSNAVDDIQKALTYGDHFYWHYILGDVYKAKQEFNNAAIHYSNSLTRDTLQEMESGYYQRGFCLYQLENWTSALPDYLKALSLQRDTASMNFHNELGRIYLQTGKLDSAHIQFNVAYKRNANDQMALYGIASAYYLQNKMDDALVWFENLFKLKVFNIGSIKKDKLISAIRDDKRFKALVKKYD